MGRICISIMADEAIEPLEGFLQPYRHFYGGPSLVFRARIIQGLHLAFNSPYGGVCPVKTTRFQWRSEAPQILYGQVFSVSVRNGPSIRRA
jgi:hypothetical protein